MRRGAGRILQYESPHRGVDVWRLGRVAQAQADLIERAQEAGEAPPSLESPKI